MQITVDTAVQFDQEYTRAQRLADDALARRNEAVLAVLESGTVRQRELAVRLGVTPGRVSQIAIAARRRREFERKHAIAAERNTALIPNVEAA
jgi:hypothetical protein